MWSNDARVELFAVTVPSRPSRVRSSHTASGERLYGYRRALERAGIAFEPALVIDGQFDFDSGVRAAAALLDQPESPTAVFAANDDMAAGALAEAHSRGVPVPAQRSVPASTIPRWQARCGRL